PSGLWHHQQDRGQPLKKTTVRMPGPSCVAKRITLKINAVRSCTPGSPRRSGTIATIFIQIGLKTCNQYGMVGAGIQGGGFPKGPLMDELDPDFRQSPESYFPAIESGLWIRPLSQELRKSISLPPQFAISREPRFPTPLAREHSTSRGNFHSPGVPPHFDPWRRRVFLLHVIGFRPAQSRLDLLYRFGLGYRGRLRWLDLASDDSLRGYSKRM